MKRYSLNQLSNRLTLKGYIVIMYPDSPGGRLALGRWHGHWDWDWVHRGTVFNTKLEAKKAFKRASTTNKTDDVKILPVRSVCVMAPDTDSLGRTIQRPLEIRHYEATIKSRFEACKNNSVKYEKESKRLAKLAKNLKKSTNNFERLIPK